MARRPPVSDWVNPAKLDAKTKLELWTGLKHLDPALADLLVNDPNISALKNCFSAYVKFTRDNARRYVMAGRKILEERNHVPPTAQQ